MTVLSLIQMEEGVINKETPGFTYEYFIKDHLGNTRIAFKPDGANKTINQSTDYYPFGMSWVGSGNIGGDNKYLYNGKELQDAMIGSKNLDWYDYGARFYDPVVGRWHEVDPLTETSYNWTPYRYAYNNPFTTIDIDGLYESTHTDSLGNVVRVINDGDNGVYRHKGGRKKTEEEVKSQHSMNNTSAGGELMGYTITWDSFVDYNNPELAVGKINFSSLEASRFITELELYLDNCLKENSGFVVRTAYGLFAGNNEYWDFKSKGDIYRGSRLNSSGSPIFISARDLGNFAAGYVAQRTGMNKLDYLITFGAFQLGNNSIMKISKFKQDAKIKGYLTYGENPRSNQAQRIGYENVRTPAEYFSKYAKIWDDK